MGTPDPEHAVAYGLFSVRQARAAGISRAELTRGVRRGRWNRVGSGVLEASDREPRPGDDVRRAVLTTGPGAVAGFGSAAMAFCWELPADPGRPEVVVPPSAHLGAPAGVRIYRSALRPSERTVYGVLPVTTPARTALDIAASTPAAHAVVVLDSALRSGSVEHRELSRYFAASQRHGVRAARRVLLQSDPASGSVPESQARLLFARADLPAPVTQFPFVIAGVLVARLDFAWPWAMLAGEIDGFAYHSLSGAFQQDRTRPNALVQAGWRILRFTVEDIRRREHYVVAQVRQALDDTVDRAIC